MIDGWQAKGQQSHLVEPAAFIMAEIGYQPAIREDRAPYIAVWQKILKRDGKATLTAGESQ